LTSTPARDRDAAGRPRNARPRDGLGRPLPRDAPAGVERVPDKLDMPLDDAIDLAQAYLDTGRPFHAHEVLEALWKSQPESERDLWQGLAQLAVGLTHALRGNVTGALALLDRGGDRVSRYVGDPHGIAIDDVVATTGACAQALRQDGGVRPEQFRLRLKTLTQ